MLLDLMDMMMLQYVGNRDLEERRLRLKEEKLQMEKESYIAGSPVEGGTKVPYYDTGDGDGVILRRFRGSYAGFQNSQGTLTAEPATSLQ